MNILIFGANGLLASNLVNQLSQTHQVIAVIREGTSPKFQLNKNVNLIEQDLSQPDVTKFPTNTEAIYYLAQSNRFREFPAGVNDMMQINIYTPLIIIQWAKKQGVRSFTYASSGGIYSMGEQENSIKEFSEINLNKVLGFYLNSKLSAEMLLNNFSSLFDCFTILRPFFIYGKNQNPTMLIPRLIHSVNNQKQITIYGSEGLVVNPIYVDDAVMACENILSLKGSYIFNLAGEESLSLKKLCLLIGKKLNKKVEFEYKNDTQKDLIADISLMKKYLHCPKIDLNQGLSAIIPTILR